MKIKILIAVTLFNLFAVCNVVVAQIPTYVPTNGLVGWWPFTGNANDISGNGNNGTVNGATLTSDRFGNANQAYSFVSSNNNRIDISGISFESEFTISIWFQTNSYTQPVYPTVFYFGLEGFGATYTRTIDLSIDNVNCSPPYVRANLNYNFGAAGSLAPNYSWRLVTTKLSNSILYFYSDGVLIQSTPASKQNLKLLASDISRIGCGNTASGNTTNFFNGKIDDIGIWNRALTQQEITQLYNANNGPQATISTANNSICAGQSTTLNATVVNAGTSCNTAGLPPTLNNGLVGYWPFCGNANDVSGNGNNGIVNGAALTTDRFGAANQSYSFDGVNDNIRVNNNALFSFLLNSSFTSNVWFKIQTLPNGTKFLISQGDGDAQHQNRLWGSYLTQNSVNNWFRGNNEPNQVFNTHPSLQVNAWKMVTMVRDFNSTIKMYIDGQLVDTDVDIAGIASPFTQIRDIYFGALYDAYNAQLTAFLNGQLDDIGIWNRALSAQEVSELYNAGQATYLWSNGATTPSITVTPTQTTTYTCTITMNGASTTQSQTITVNAIPTVSAGQNQAICAGTAVTLIGSGAATYAWSNNIQNGVPFTPLSTQTYTVTGTTTSGCVNTAQVTVSVNPLPTVNAGQAQTVCAGTSVTLSGSGASTYTWNNNIQNGVSFTPLLTQTYTVTGTDINGCTNTSQVQVVVNALPAVSGGQNQSVCAGASLVLNGAGALTYTWNNNIQNGVSFIPNTTQTYTVIGTNANGCQNSAQVQVTVNPLPTVGAGLPFGVCSGAYVVLNGSGAQTYAWSNGIQNAVPFVPGNTQVYTVTGTDSNGCTDTDQILVTVNSYPQVSAGQNQTVCAGDSVTLTASGAPSYTWSNGLVNGFSFVPASTTTYSVIGNSNGCLDTAQVTITVNPLPTVSAGQAQTVCAGSSVTLNATGASTYLWDNNVQNSVAFIPDTTQTYTVTGTDINGCENTAQITVIVHALPTVSGGQNQSVCAGATLVLNGAGALTYTWNNTVQNGVAFIPSTTQTYTVIGTDTNGCQGTDQVLVEVLSPTVSEINEVACVEFTLNGQSYTQSGAYIQNLSNVAGCDSTLTLNLTINELPSIPVISSSNDNILSINAQANVTYQWIFCNSGLSINNATDTIYSPTVNGVYGIELTNGCGTVSSECVTINNMNVPEILNEILVYPNPSLDLVYIEGLTETSIPFKLQDVTGRAVLEGMFNASSYVLDVTRLSSGNYRILIPGYGIFSLVKQ
jgi:hypothetical protein